MALFGVSGKISSGKDTVGKIIQYLVWKSRVEKGELPLSVYSFSDFARETSFGKNQSGYEIKKYADKLKDFVCMLIGCTREQLEDQEFKNKILPEEWAKYCITTIEGNWAVSTNGHPYYFTTKEACEIHLQDILNFKVSKHYMTPRLLLQIIGTECIRDKVHPNAWVNALFADYKANNLKYHHAYTKEGVNHGLQTLGYPNWIITDMRFPNELEAVKSRGGITIRINRPYSTVVGDNGIPATFNHTQFHPSETALDDAEFDYTIENDSSIEDLIHTVSLILKREKII